MKTAYRFELLTLGDELLLGLTANGHLTFIGQQLGRRGVQLQRNVTITDEADAIAKQFADSWLTADVVITTGGLGPTCDDRTREAIAERLGQKIILDAAVEAHIRERFARLGRTMTPNNLKQAYRPEKAEVLPNPNGTAPGLWIEQDGKILVMLPGPPNELQPMFIEEVLPRLAKCGRVAESEAYVQIRTAGVGESALETMLEPLFAPYGNKLSIAFCAHQGSVDCRLSSPNGKLSKEAIHALAEQCAAKLGEDFVCFGHHSLAEVAADLMRSHEKTLAVAESCTGGLLSNCFTDVCGATKFFRGGIVCYSNDSKVQLLDVPECLLAQHSAVSAEAAIAMATGAAETLEADYSLSITGFAGPCGGTAANPVGTIYIGLHSPEGVWSRRLNYPGARGAVKQRAVDAALDWLRREIIREAAGHGAAIPQRVVEPAR